ncbi:hypothetical protein E2562_036808 [Oryza meyeriana var. granulata]|uniref:PWWP domain-containing protein n=1 Tax=Oryza meyeriana var. granulata TaxID=110450 RepID=A0A6G1ETD4_9ORYZ|nr:hypothetical protein E2562_036808 [Oryza meyeriana var. granulata]
MGGWAKDVSSSEEGTLVWVRRPNGSWWPGRVISPLDVPDGCPGPPKSPATPIMLLGRRQGPTYIDWCNLERTKRVKPFRCGESEFDEYARKEDAILQALQIERARLQDAASKNHSADARSKVLNVATTKSCHAAARDAPSSTAINPPSPKRKRKTPNDSEDDVPQGFPRMRDLSDIGSNTFPKRIPSVATFSDFSDDLPTTCPIKRSRQSHATAKRKQPYPNLDGVFGSVLPPELKTPGPARCHAVKPTKTLQLNPILYDVELSGHGCTNKGRRVPLVSLMSRWNRRPVVGYPVSVEVSDGGVCFLPASGVNDHHAATGIVNGLLKKDEAASPGRLRSHMGGAKPKSCRKMSELEMDKSWRPHTKNHMPSSRKMRRLSSFEINQRGAGDKKMRKTINSNRRDTSALDPRSTARAQGPAMTQE